MSYRIPQTCPHKPVSINNHPKVYNLDVRNYSFDEILGLFELDLNLTIEDLKRAKKKVLMIHPDKSKLPPDYFLFYKKAFEMVVSYFESVSKGLHFDSSEQTTNTPQAEVKYQPMNNFKMPSGIAKKISGMNTSDFSSRFNQVFEENVAKPVDNSRYEWFKAETPVFEAPKNVSASNLGSTFDSMKQKQREMGIMRYTGVHELKTGYNTSSFYDGDENPDEYISCDPFSKLKFDDLRKVHKDQTIFNVSEADIRDRPVYKSVDEYRNANSGNYSVMDKEAAERVLEMQQKADMERNARLRHQHELNMAENAKRNAAFINGFLRLT